jgi:putative ABC transport system permease protein
MASVYDRGGRGQMWALTLRDLMFRRRQFTIAVIGSALVFALALALTGMSAGFRSEAQQTSRSVGATTWIVPSGVEGPFTSLSILDEGLAGRIAATPGVHDAQPLVVFPTTAQVKGTPTGVSLVGFVPGRLGQPQGVSGHAVTAPGQAVADSRVGLGTGGVLTIAGRRFGIVGTVTGKTILAGVPVVYVGLADAQAVAFGGQRVASAIVTAGTPASVPAGFHALTTNDVRNDLLRPMKNPTKTIDNTRLLMWIVAGVIIGIVTYLAALDRVRDFAVLKAVGASSRVLAASLCVEAVLASLLAAGVAALLANLLRPAFSLPLTITGAAYATLPVIAAVVGMLASLFALRRAVRVDPALAFGG